MSYISIKNLKVGQKIDLKSDFIKWREDYNTIDRRNYSIIGCEISEVQWTYGNAILDVFNRLVILPNQNFEMYKICFDGYNVEIIGFRRTYEKGKNGNVLLYDFTDYNLRPISEKMSEHEAAGCVAEMFEKMKQIVLDDRANGIYRQDFSGKKTI